MDWIPATFGTHLIFYLDELCQYFNRNGHLRIGKSEGGRNLYAWIQRVRKAHENGKPLAPGLIESDFTRIPGWSWTQNVRTYRFEHLLDSQGIVDKKERKCERDRLRNLERTVKAHAAKDLDHKNFLKLAVQAMRDVKMIGKSPAEKFFRMSALSLVTEESVEVDFDSIMKKDFVVVGHGTLHRVQEWELDEGKCTPPVC